MDYILTQAPHRKKLKVSGFSSDHSGLSSRLKCLGFNLNEEIELIRVLPFGGPLIVRLKTIDIALRTEEAEVISVRIHDGQ